MKPYDNVYDTYDFEAIEKDNPIDSQLSIIEETTTPGFLPSLIASGLLVLLSTAAVIISWILYARERNSYLLYFSISLSVFFLLSIYFVLFFLEQNRKSKKINNYVEGSFQYNLVFCLLFLLGTLFLVTGLYILIYRPFHYYKMNKQFGTSDWGKRGPSFEAEWAQDKQLLLSLGLLSMIMSFFCFVCCLNLYSNNIDKSNLTVLLIYISLCVAFVFACVALREYYLIRKFEIEMGETSTLWKDITLELLKWFLIVVLIVTFLAALFEAINLKFTLGLAGTALLIVGLVGVVITATYTKSFDTEIKKNFYNFGREILKRQKNDEFCGPKYAQNVNVCSRDDYFMKWDSSEQVLLNKDCFSKAARKYYFYYFRFLIYCGLVFCFCFLAAVGHFMYFEYNHMELGTKYLAFIVLGIMLVFFLVFLFLLIFLYKPDLNGSYAEYLKKQDNRFQPVPPELQI